MKNPFSKTITGLITSVVLLGSVGCASIVSHTSWPVRISSNPDHANITVTDRKGTTVYSGATPANLDLRSGAGFFTAARYSVRFNKSGYAEHVEQITCGVNGWYWGNILFGGLIGWLIVDPATGAMYRIRTPFVYAQMTPSTSSLEHPELRIIDINDLSAEQIACLERLK